MTSHKEAIALLRARPDLAERLLMLANEPTEAPVTGPDEAAALFRPLLAGFDTERCVVAAFDRRYRAIDTATITIGTDWATIVDPRLVLRWALTRSRVPHALMIAHNHPSGDPTPSPEDIAVTRRMIDACRAVGVECLDHVVIGSGDRFASIRSTYPDLSWSAPRAPIFAY